MAKDDNRKLIEQFVKTFHVALKNASIYSENHPSFFKSVDHVYEALQEAIQFQPQLQIALSPDKVFFESEPFDEKIGIYGDFAGYFHSKRIKAFTVSTSISVEDLKKVIVRISKLERVTHTDFGDIASFSVEELDYSFLLSQKGAHPENIWNIVLGRTPSHSISSEKEYGYISENIAGILGELSRHEQALSQFNALRVWNDIKEHIQEKNPELVLAFTQKFVSTLLNFDRKFLTKFQDLFPQSELESYLKTLPAEQLAGIFSESFFMNDQVDPLMLEVISTLVGKIDDKVSVGEILGEKLSETNIPHDMSFMNSLKELFYDNSSDQFISSVYRKVLADSLVQENVLSPVQVAYPSEEELAVNFFYMLLNLLQMEKIPEQYEFILRAILQELPHFLATKQSQILEDTFTTIQAEEQRIKDLPQLKEIFETSQQQILTAEFIDILFKSSCQGGKQKLSALAERFVKDVRHTEAMVQMLFDPDYDEFLGELLSHMNHYACVVAIREKIQPGSTHVLMRKALRILSFLHTAESFYLLVDFYKDEHWDFLRLEILHALDGNQFQDKNFLLEICVCENFPLRRKAVENLIHLKDEDSLQKAAQLLFAVPNFLGKNDEIISKNIMIAREFLLKQSVGYLTRICLSRPLVFTRRRDKVRLEAFMALSHIDVQAAVKLWPQLINDRDEKIRLLIKECQHGTAI